MNTNNIHSEKLFSYGTLQYESVQLSTFGRKLIGSKDSLTGYQLTQLEITDQHVINTSGSATHPILILTDNPMDEVSGTVFKVSTKELEEADKYEVKDYKRISIQLRSGTQAWVY